MTDDSTTIYEAEPLPPIRYDVTAAGLQSMRDQAAKLPTAVESVKDRRACTDLRQEVRGVRVAVEKRRKELKKDALEYGRRVDSIAREITAAIREIEDPITERIEAYDAEVERRRREREEAERAHREALQARVQEILDIPAALAGRPAPEIKAEAEALQACDLTEDVFEDRLDHARAARAKTLERLERMHTEAIEEEERRRQEAEEAARREAELAAERERLEAERAEMERQRAVEEEERRKADEAARLKREQEESEAAERRLQEEERLRAERAKLDAERKEIERERAAQEAEAKAEQEAAKRAVDAVIEADAVVEYLADHMGLDWDVARKVTSAIVAGDVPHVRYTGGGAE